MCINRLNRHLLSLQNQSPFKEGLVRLARLHMTFVQIHAGLEPKWAGV